MKLYYEEYNSDHAETLPIYLIHTIPLDHNYLTNTIPEELNLHIVALDLPGHGKTDNFEGDEYSFQDMASDIENLRVSKDHDKIIILGHGVGGFVAMEYIINYSDQVDRMILVNTAPNAKYREMLAWNIREKYSKVTIQALEEYKGQTDDKSIRVRFTQSLARYFEPTDHNAAKKLMDNSERIASEAYVHISHRLLPHVNYRPKLRNVEQPVLVIACTKDVWPDLSSQLIRNDIIHSKYTEFETGHFPMMEIPDKFWKRIKEFTNE